MAIQRELSPVAFWAILAVVALVVLGAVYFLASPTHGEQAPKGPPPAIKQGSAKGPPPPPASGFPTHSN
jgi:hypothetical protein